MQAVGYEEWIGAYQLFLQPGAMSHGKCPVQSILGKPAVVRPKWCH